MENPKSGSVFEIEEGSTLSHPVTRARPSASGESEPSSWLEYKSDGVSLGHLPLLGGGGSDAP